MDLLCCAYCCINWYTWLRTYIESIKRGKYEYTFLKIIDIQLIRGIKGIFIHPKRLTNFYFIFFLCDKRSHWDLKQKKCIMCVYIKRCE